MNNNLEEIIDFFTPSNITNCSFYIHCPTLKEEEKKDISSLIIKNKAVSKILNIIIIYILENYFHNISRNYYYSRKQK